MYADKGIGLAATQVNYHERLIVIDVSENQDEPIYIVNPSYEVLDSSPEPSKEGCLSIPTFQQEVLRAKKIELAYQDLDGKPQKLTAEGLFGYCIQHEIDHLNGVTIHDRENKPTPIMNKDKKIGRNDKVTLQKDGEIKTLKYKNAQKFFEDGWVME